MSTRVRLSRQVRRVFRSRSRFLTNVDRYQGPVFSGNSPGIQREARAAGKASRNGARGPSDTRTFRAANAGTIRRA
jgi:hypothetical protein